MLSKAFGGKEMWKIDGNNVYSTEILQVYTGMKKNYMLELELPPETRQLQDFEKNATLLKATCSLQQPSSDTLVRHTRTYLHASLNVHLRNSTDPHTPSV